MNWTVSIWKPPFRGHAGVTPDEGLVGAPGQAGEPEAGAAADTSHGTRAIYRRPRTSQPEPGSRPYPYLLGKTEITRSNQAWAADVTYIFKAQGFLYLVAIMDWYSLYVPAWRLSNTLEADFCIDALDEALGREVPEVFNTDQGSQFTGQGFTQTLQDQGVKITTGRAGTKTTSLWSGCGGR